MEMGGSRIGNTPSGEDENGFSTGALDEATSFAAQAPFAK